jgi:hypothetical protein
LPPVLNIVSPAWYADASQFRIAVKETFMGLFEEVAGAVVAVEGVKKLDPNAGIFTEGIAAVAGFEGTEAIVDHFEKKDDENQG